MISLSPGEGRRTSECSRILLQCPRRRAVGQTIAAPGAFSFEHFIHVMDVLHLRMDRVLGANLAAQAAGDAKTFANSDFHVYCDPPKARLGSGAQGLKRKSKTSSMGFCSLRVSA